MEPDIKFRQAERLLICSDYKDDIRQKFADDRKEANKLKPKPQRRQAPKKPRERDDLRSAPVFVQEFRKHVRDRFPKANFPSNDFLGEEAAAATEAIDLLYARECKSSQTAVAWMRWFVAKKMSEKAAMYPVTVRMLKKSWDDFVKVKPDENRKSDKSQPTNTPSDAIGDRMADILKDGLSQENISYACSIFGVVLTANYLATYPMPVPAVLELMDEAITKSNDRVRHLMFCSTCRYSVGKATDSRMILIDWERRYPGMVSAGSSSDRPRPMLTQKEYIDRFVDANGLLEKAK